MLKKTKDALVFVMSWPTGVAFRTVFFGCDRRLVSQHDRHVDHEDVAHGSLPDRDGTQPHQGPDHACGVRQVYVRRRCVLGEETRSGDAA